LDKQDSLMRGGLRYKQPSALSTYYKLLHRRNCWQHSPVTDRPQSQIL